MVVMVITQVKQTYSRLSSTMIGDRLAGWNINHCTEGAFFWDFGVSELYSNSKIMKAQQNIAVSTDTDFHSLPVSLTNAIRCS